jgi:hypothetical protein
MVHSHPTRELPTTNKETKMTATLLNDLQRQRLRDLALTPAALEAYVEELHDQYPEAFHVEHKSLSERVFVDEPVFSIPHARFVRPVKESYYCLVPETT